MDVSRKRSSRIRLVLLGGLASGLLTGCGQNKGERPPVSARVYPNDYYVSGLGYYHAPFGNWYSRPYNAYDPASRSYFYGGQWGARPHESVVNLSEPTPGALAALRQATGLSRGGFGNSSHGRSYFS